MKIFSSAFTDGGMIPSSYTCDGENVSPQLQWLDVPPKTVTLALIADDPDAPVGIWVHWVVYNIPPAATGFAEAVPVDKKLSNGAIQGKNDFHQIGYGGPCPPGGTHRYYFKLYALDAKVSLPPGAAKRDLVNAMSGHILQETQMMGKYKRQR